MLLLPIISVYAQDVDFGELVISPLFSNGERAGPYGIEIKIYNENTNDLIENLKPNFTSPYFVTKLPMEHKYRIETFVNDMKISTDIFKLTDSFQIIEPKLLYPAGLKYNVYYNDGQTPLQGSKIQLLSHNGTVISEDYIDNQGQSLRFWISPTIEPSNYYFPVISIDENLTFNGTTIKLNPGQMKDVDIVTPWPKVINSLITVSIEKDKENRELNFENYTVGLVDKNKQQVKKSNIDWQNRAFFSNIKVGSYFIRITDEANKDSSYIHELPITLTGETENIRIQAAEIVPKMKVDTTTKISSNTNHNLEHNIDSYSNENTTIPNWIKLNAEQWLTNEIDDVVFASNIKHLLSEPSQQNQDTQSKSLTQVNIPTWLEYNVKWWTEEKITDHDFVSGIKYLLHRNILSY